MKTAKADRTPHLSEIIEIRRRACEHLARGAVTPSYGGDAHLAVRVLNEALATEIVRTLRYRSHYFLADCIQAEAIQGEFLDHAQEKEEHAEKISRRIRQLGGVPNWNPDGILSRSHSEFTSRPSDERQPAYQSGSLIQMLEEDLVAERIAIESYREMVRFFGENDPTTRRLLESILAREEEHAEEISSLLMRLTDAV
jgi:bacterioferritin